MRRIGSDGIRYNSYMSLSLEEVEHIAKLARLDLTDAEKSRYRVQLSAILEHVAQLQKLDTAAIQPMAGVFSVENPLRGRQVSVSSNRSIGIKQVATDTAAGSTNLAYHITNDGCTINNSLSDLN